MPIRLTKTTKKYLIGRAKRNDARRFARYEDVLTKCQRKAVRQMLSKNERNVAAKLRGRPPLPLDEISWWPSGIAKGAKLGRNLV